MTETKKVGLDGGNSGVKLYAGEGEVIKLHIPSVTSMYIGEKVSKLDSSDIDVNDLENNIDITINSKALTFNDVRYVVGNKVLEDKMSTTETEENSNKATDDVIAIVSLAALTVLAIKDNPESNNIKVKYDLGLNLPVNDISKETAKLNNERFIGTHEVIYHHPSERDVKVTIEVEFANTLPEGSSAAWGIVFDVKGKLNEIKIEENETIQKVHLEDKTLLHFDIGGGSSEIVVTQGVAFRPNLSVGLTYGVKKTINDILAVWNHENKKKTIDSVSEFNSIYLDPTHPRHLKLKEISRPSLMQLANKFSAEMINKIDSLKDDPYVFVYGGGSKILQEFLTQILIKKDRMTNIVFVDDALFANARGSKIYTESPRFKIKKEEYLGVVQNG